MTLLDRAMTLLRHEYAAHGKESTLETQRDLIARGIFTFVKNLDRKIMRYIRSYDRKATQSKGLTKMLPTTPTHSLWLNQVEIWFSKIQGDVIARGIFASVKDLDRKLIRYIRSYNKRAKPFKWTYAETERRIRTTKKATKRCTSTSAAFRCFLEDAFDG